MLPLFFYFQLRAVLTALKQLYIELLY